MCGRYVLALQASAVRARLAEQNMPAEEAPDDDDNSLRQSYNFAPGYHGLIYRAAPNNRAGTPPQPPAEGQDEPGPSPRKRARRNSPRRAANATVNTGTTDHDNTIPRQTRYKLQTAKWGLVPSWSKRQPPWSEVSKRINCRDDSLASDYGIWKSMKKRKRCVVIAEGFYEWLKKNNGKDRIPYYTKRKDGQLMCFAGLWDCAQYEDTEESVYTYTIITTDNNPQLAFLHNRMPVILEPGSDAMKLWLDPTVSEWTKPLQDMLRPFKGELECYQVDKAVGKVGNDSPNFVVPINSKENKGSIAHFFGVQKARQAQASSSKTKNDPDEDQETTVKVEDPESNAPLPTSDQEPAESRRSHVKAQTPEPEDQMAGLDDDDLLEAERSLSRGVYRYKNVPTQPPLRAPDFGKVGARSR